MAGRGPAPKPADRRARRNADLVVSSRLRLVRAAAPELPSLGLRADGSEIEWHPQTVAWWRVWAGSQLARDFTSTDWSFLLDTALMHHAMWSRGQWTLAAEVRLRVAKFGATPEDRARLRIILEDADAAEDRGVRRRERRGVTQPKRSADPRRVLSSAS